MSYMPLKVADIKAGVLEALQAGPLSLAAGATGTVTLTVPTGKVLIVKKVTDERSGVDVSIDRDVKVDGKNVTAVGVTGLGLASYDLEDNFGVLAIAKEKVEATFYNAGTVAEDAYLNVYAVVIDEVYLPRRETMM